MDKPAAVNRDKCLVENCPNTPRYRGLCQSCHQSARRAIATRQVTESQLVEKRLLLPSARGRRKRKSPWQIQFERACGKQE